MSRAFCIEFKPTIQEVHLHVGNWYGDEEIYQFVGDNLPLIIDIDVRDYVQARKLKAHGEDWKTWLLERWVEDKRLVPVLKILGDPTLTASNQRIEKFRQETGHCRRTFMYLQAEIRRLRGTMAPVSPVRVPLRGRPQTRI